MAQRSPKRIRYFFVRWRNNFIFFGWTTTEYFVNGPVAPVLLLFCLRIFFLEWSWCGNISVNCNRKESVMWDEKSEQVKLAAEPERMEGKKAKIPLLSGSFSGFKANQLFIYITWEFLEKKPFLSKWKINRVPFTFFPPFFPPIEFFFSQPRHTHIYNILCVFVCVCVCAPKKIFFVVLSLFSNIKNNPGEKRDDERNVLVCVHTLKCPRGKQRVESTHGEKEKKGGENFSSSAFSTVSKI